MICYSLCLSDIGAPFGSQKILPVLRPIHGATPSMAHREFWRCGSPTDMHEDPSPPHRIAKASRHSVPDLY